MSQPPVERRETPSPEGDPVADHRRPERRHPADMDDDGSLGAANLEARPIEPGRSMWRGAVPILAITALAAAILYWLLRS